MYSEAGWRHLEQGIRWFDIAGGEELRHPIEIVTHPMSNSNIPLRVFIVSIGRK